MDSNTQDDILKWFDLASGEPSRTRGAEDADQPLLTEAGGTAESSVATTGASATLRSQIGTAPTSAGQNVHGGSQTDNPGGGSSAGSILTDVFESGFGVAPLVGELLGLFGGGATSPAAPVKYEMPASISFMSAETADGMGAAGYDQMDLPRLYDEAGSAPMSEGETGGASPRQSAANRPAAGAAAPQITVSVQAMDAQSFMDRSSDIAQAVRSAMLSMNAINDMVNEI